MTWFAAAVTIYFWPGPDVLVQPPDPKLQDEVIKAGGLRNSYLFCDQFWVHDA